MGGWCAAGDHIAESCGRARRGVRGAREAAAGRERWPGLSCSWNMPVFRQLARENPLSLLGREPGAPGQEGVVGTRPGSEPGPWLRPAGTGPCAQSGDPCPCAPPPTDEEDKDSLQELATEQKCFVEHILCTKPLPCR